MYTFTLNFYVRLIAHHMWPVIVHVPKVSQKRLYIYPLLCVLKRQDWITQFNWTFVFLSFLFCLASDTYFNFSQHNIFLSLCIFLYFLLYRSNLFGVGLKPAWTAVWKYPFGNLSFFSFFAFSSFFSSFPSLFVIFLFFFCGFYSIVKCPHVSTNTNVTTDQRICNDERFKLETILLLDYLHVRTKVS